jgi:tetratricopeptide (TPR) repeat protein
MAAFLDDVRAVLDWALNARNDPRLGVDLTTCSASLWIQRSLFNEYQARVEIALECGNQARILERRDKLRLYMALGHLVLHTKKELDDMSIAFARALEAAQDGTVAERCQALGSMWVAAIALANYPAAIECARKFREIADGSDTAAQMAYCRMLALPNHFLGHHAVTRELVAQILQQPAPVIRLAYKTGLQIDVKVSMETMLSRSAWLEGRPDEALERASSMVDWALTNSSAGSICYCLAIGAAPIALWSGDWTHARSFIQQLEATAEEGGLRFWTRWATCLHYALLHQTGDVRESVDPQEWGEKQIDFLVTVGVESALERGLVRVEKGLTAWSAPEIMRVSAERAIRVSGLQQGQESLFRSALMLADGQGARSWELRIATSVAKITQGTERARAVELLRRTMSRIQGGKTTKDVIGAASLLESIEHAS